MTFKRAVIYKKKLEAKETHLEDEDENLRCVIMINNIPQNYCKQICKL